MRVLMKKWQNTILRWLIPQRFSTSAAGMLGRNPLPSTHDLSEDIVKLRGGMDEFVSLPFLYPWGHPMRRWTSPLSESAGPLTEIYLSSSPLDEDTSRISSQDPSLEGLTVIQKYRGSSGWTFEPFVFICQPYTFCAHFPSIENFVELCFSDCV